MTDEAKLSGIQSDDSEEPKQPEPSGADDAAPVSEAPALPVAPAPWHKFIRTASDKEIQSRFTTEIAAIVESYGLEDYCWLALLEPINSIDTIDLDRIFESLVERNPEKDRDVVLVLLSRGGSIEPAYQISKLCKSYSSGRFVVVVPRFAKSAATLIALGADEIHIGPLGQLGPIDPQVGGLPALGVSQALQTIASVAEKHPGSADMLARYLRMALTVEQIGYCDRISESAVQYAERLLSTKESLQSSAPSIARTLVHEYKDHGFVIDIDEAQHLLGSNWILSETPELAAAEDIYSKFDFVNILLGERRMLVLGAIDRVESIMILSKKRNSA